MTPSWDRPPERDPECGGRVVAVVGPGDRVAMPWKNGGGVTHELVRRETDGEGAGFSVRVSIATVASDGPFSQFPGVDRVILLLQGAGFLLRRADGVEVSVDRPLVPFAFRGEDAWACTLRAGPVVDFNVMTHRAVCRAVVRVCGAGWVDATWIYALTAGRVGGVEVEAGSLVALDGPVETAVPGIAVRVTDVSPP